MEISHVQNIGRVLMSQKKTSSRRFLMLFYYVSHGPNTFLIHFVVKFPWWANRQPLLGTDAVLVEWTDIDRCAISVKIFCTWVCLSRHPEQLWELTGSDGTSGDASGTRGANSILSLFTLVGCSVGLFVLCKSNVDVRKIIAVDSFCFRCCEESTLLPTEKIYSCSMCTYKHQQWIAARAAFLAPWLRTGQTSVFLMFPPNTTK